ncbi:ATP-binding protein [Polaribacter sp. AHE13PA]|jgi:DNA helicase HerA-like ATPase|uniref:ATP-binding protein n=1 Tax=Polaribacter sp. AHE13PA TaxID=2745562 RepID=UPI001C4F40DD|nr:ATP-binding protein [Polaribacter sp. AHE13PA]QXP67829.1 ATP-binding protein [Polaribacter sp. AHE13PA]
MENKELIKIGTVIESASNSIMIRIENDETFEKNKQAIQIGKYLQIKEGNHNYVICVIQSIKINDDNNKYIINSQPIGIFSEGFKQGSSILPSPTEEVFIVSKDVMSKIFSKDSDYSFKFGELIQNREINLHINGNSFFSKHIAVVGSTGSGKSCTVAKILQDVVGINKKTNLNNGNQKNAHVIIFDIHSEYKSAFEIDSKENFNLNALDVDKLKLPYWLMNSEELESLFIESNEQNSHNQVSQFKKAVTLNKEKHNSTLKNVNYDTPVYFNIQEVYNFICNKNNLTVYKKGDKLLLATLSFEKEYSENDLWNEIIFETSTANSKHATFGEKVAKYGGFNGEFERFISRLETKINDKRLSFILEPIKDDRKLYKTDDFEEILKQFLGYLDKSNITIIDLSGVPFEVLSITVSLISRLVFDFAFHYSKLRHSTSELNDIPFLIVCEEAHNYIPKSGGAEYKASKKSIERIAKEGRKYGLSLMVVSQRPSEVSDTIFSQCNNFVALRLTNISDQNYIKGLLPNNANSITDILPTLSAGECLIVGDATPMPAIVQMEMPDPEPKSESIKFHSQWENEWTDVTFSDVIKRWRKE